MDLPPSSVKKQTLWSALYQVGSHKSTVPLGHRAMRSGVVRMENKASRGRAGSVVRPTGRSQGQDAFAIDTMQEGNLSR